MSIDPVIRDIQSWIESFIIGLNICPFAAGIVDRILFVHHKETHHVTVANQVFETIQKIRSQPTYVTGFVIMPKNRLLFEDFFDLTQVLQEQVDERWPDEYVLVAFHPEFRYEGEREDNIVNAVNRSPHPMIHLLTTDSLDEAAEDTGASARITDANIKKLKKLSWQALFTRYGVKYQPRY